MSGRDRERDRRAAAAAQRTNEYFVPGVGIDREVITADICRYLGNDALVRPGTYEDPATRQARSGFFITAYRNLTTAMIADLKADSERWENERRQTAAATRGQPNVGYRDSTTHQSRQYYGPTEPTSGTPQYASGAATQGQVVYDNGPSYQQPNYAQPSGPGYAQPGYAVVSDYSYVAGADLVADRPRGSAGQPSVPRSNVSNVQYSGNNSYQQPDSRGTYYSGQAGPPVSSAQSYQTQQPQDPYYGRDEMYAAQDPYGNRAYPENASYQTQPVQTPPTTAPVVPNTSSRRERERDPEPRDRHGHRSRR